LTWPLKSRWGRSAAFCSNFGDCYGTNSPVVGWMTNPCPRLPRRSRFRAASTEAPRSLSARLACRQPISPGIRILAVFIPNPPDFSPYAIFIGDVRHRSGKIVSAMVAMTTSSPPQPSSPQPLKKRKRDDLLNKENTLRITTTNLKSLPNIDQCITPPAVPIPEGGPNRQILNHDGHPSNQCLQKS